MSGACLGQFTLIPLFTIFTSRYGWRLSYLYMGLATLGVNAGLALLVMKPHPDSIAVQDKSSHVQKRDPALHEPAEAGLREAQRDFTLRQAMKTRAFWLYLLVMFVCGSGDFLVTAHLIPCVTDYSISATTAGNMLAWLGLLSLAGILIAGPASDVFGNKIPVILTFILRFLLFLFVLGHHDVVSFYIFSLGFGFTLLVTAPLTTTLMGRLYGFSHIGLISGFITTIHHLGGGFWAYMGGVLYDRAGNYHLAFGLSALMALIAAASALLMVEKSYHLRQDRAQD
jgi:predicted MFS family arabinose efflux permease